MRLISVVLPLPVLPTIAVVWPGSTSKRDVAQDRVLGARVAELDVAEVEGARPGGGGASGCSGSSIDGLRPEDLLDPARRDDRRAGRG